MTIVILTPIQVEFLAVKAFLESVEEEKLAGQYFTIGRFEGNYQSFRVILKETGPRVDQLALMTERMVNLYKPSLIILTGIAGGVKDVSLGDVIVATKAYGYEAGKSTAKGFDNRPDVLPFNVEMIEEAKRIAQKGGWKSRIKVEKPNNVPKVIFGPIASGKQVIASTQSEVYQKIKKYYNDTVAVEMEAIGFAKSLQAYPMIYNLNIRGASDLLDDKNSGHDATHQPKAAAHAAAFVFELLFQLNPKQLNIQPMEIKNIAKDVVAFLFPLLKLDSIKEIGAEFKDATDQTIKDLWEKVRSVFIKEIEEEEQLDEAKGAIRSALRQKMKKEDNFKQELEVLLKGINSDAESKSGVAIINSKNVIAGSNISVGRDFSIGE